MSFKNMPAPPIPTAVLTADQAIVGPRIPPQQQIILYSAGQWEEFVHEWVHFCLRKLYIEVHRFSGANDKGIDIVGFADVKKLEGAWDNYQCKHYDHALWPSDAWPELGKVVWYSFKGDYKPPRRYCFVAPRGAGTTLAGLLANATKLKQQLIENWDKHCLSTITQTEAIKLEGAFRTYVEQFDFSIFEVRAALSIIEEHKGTPYYVSRFGGGLPARPAAGAPPIGIAPLESRYVEQLMRAYADHTKNPVADTDGLKKWPKLNDHFSRQRVAFYHAESLRLFARDSVPPGTFESLLNDVHTGVVDTNDDDHADGYQRVCAVTKAARELQITSNVLITRANPLDRDGICHQLANEDRLSWTKP
jgi:hypothetical protein